MTVQILQLAKRHNFDLQSLQLEATVLAITEGKDTSLHVAAIRLVEYMEEYREWWERGTSV